MSKAGIPTRHRLKRNYSIGPKISWMQATCSCGWIGNKHYEREDSRWPDVQREEAKHVADAELLINQDEDQ